MHGQHTSCGQGLSVVALYWGFSLVVMWWLLQVVAVITLVAVCKGLISSCGGISNLVLSKRLLSSCSGVQLSSCGRGSNF